MLKCSLQQKTAHLDMDLVQKAVAEEPYSLTDLLQKQAFGGEFQGLGMPVMGIRDGGQVHLTTQHLSSFYRHSYTLDRVYVAASGVADHAEFCKQVESQINELGDLHPKGTASVPSKYTGGRLAFQTSNAENLQYQHLDQETLEKLPEELEAGILFESFPWPADQMVPLNVAYTLLGNSQSFSSGGPGKGMHARTTYMLNTTYYLNSAAAVNTVFTDSGVFGLQASGNYQQGAQLVSLLGKQLQQMRRPIGEVELGRAKNILKSNVNLVLQRQQDRLEESVKNIHFTGEVGHDQYNSKIEKVNTDHINENMEKMFRKEPTYVTRGKHPDNLPSLEAVKALFQ